MIDLSTLKSRFPDVPLELQPLLKRGVESETPSDDGQWFITLADYRLLEVMGFLRDEPQYAFEQLCDLTCVDYFNFPRAKDRYGVNYSLLSLTHNHRLWVKCYVNDPKPTVPSVCSVWPGADWMEREVYDMFGIVFDGHPDLRRILTWDGFEDYPLRKDYPLRGKGERENYEVTMRDSV